MKKARIILIAILILAIAGTAVALRTTTKYTGLLCFTATHSYSANGTLYSRAATFIAPHLSLYVSPLGPANFTCFSTTGTISGRITLTEVGGIATITVPVWVGFTYSTRVTTAN
ncbi:hypothetical protein [Chitinophaga ginsengisoli]|uniref:Uncharacterized protein n=1 Tax=Chitinophaga ginsengisoli TaxID=363837 RepID=A0A2P8GQ52_9BACT|nr:hypothetical protein [Chitinophaga ginsengisoli]PSL36098.1 hypothetical protein CLV42_101867 [Chitinophaga ginsengisoli]